MKANEYVDHPLDWRTAYSQMMLFADKWVFTESVGGRIKKTLWVSTAVDRLTQAGLVFILNKEILTVVF